MKKKLASMVIICMMAASVCACGGNKDDGETTEVVSTDGNMEDSETTETESADGNSEDLGEHMEAYESAYGYTMEYYSDLFEVINDEGADCFQLIDQKPEDYCCVYIAVSPMERGTMETIAEGIALQSGKDDTKIEDVTMGKESYAAKRVVYEIEAEDILTIRSYVVQAKDKLFLVELASEAYVSADYDSKLEEMAATFYVPDSMGETSGAEEIAGDLADNPDGTEEIAGDLADNPDGTEEIAGDLADNPGERTIDTLDGEFVGWADGHTVEVNVNGKPEAFMVEDESVKEILNNFEKGTLFTFEVETEGEVRRMIQVIGE